MGTVSSPTISPVVARRIDKAYSRIRRHISKATHAHRMGNMDAYYCLERRLRGLVHDFTILLVDTLRAMGYQADAYSKSSYLMLDTVISINLTNWQLGEWYTMNVWSYGKPQYNVSVNDPYFGVQAVLSPYAGDGVCIYGIQEVMTTLHTIRTTIDTYRQCKSCYWSSDGGDYCGAGVVPDLPTCNQYRHYSMQGLLSWV